MPNENLMKIKIAIDDKTKEASKKIDEMLEKFGVTAQQSNQKASQSNQRLANQMRSTNAQIEEAARNMSKIGRHGQESFSRLSKSQQDAVIRFNMLDKSAQQVLSHINEYGRYGIHDLSIAIENARNKFDGLSNATRTFGGSLEYSRSKMQLLGVNTDTLRGKIQLVGSGIQTYVGAKWDSVKAKVTTVGSHIKSSLNSALSSVKGKIESIGNAFGGLGGIISSVFGTIGMNSFKEMTIGLAISREQVKALGQATFGAGAEFDSMFSKMDSLTTQGVVGLDELTRAMSTIKMSTGASTAQLEQMMPVVNDIGQRAIMMGRTGEEAVSLMQAAGKGLNGEFAMLQDNFGITKQKLMDLGWSGASSDVEGYTKALQAYLEKGGDMSGLLDTTQGKITTFTKNMRIAGRNIGQQFTPYLNQALDLLIKFTDPEHGNGLGQILIGALGLSSAFMTLAPSITPALQAFDILTAKGKTLLIFLGLMKGEEDALTLATLRESIAQKASAVSKSVSAAATAAYSTIVGILTGKITLVSAATAVWNAILEMNPIMLVVIALVALVAIIYEVGKAFGWWSNVQEMLNAIWTGIQKVWGAFVNHPDVQALIQSISNAWNWLSTSIGGVVNSIMKFFGVAGSGDFDFVAAGIAIVTTAVNALAVPIRGVLGLLQFLYPYFEEFYQSVLMPMGEFLVSIFAPVWNVIVQVLNMVWSAVTRINEAFSQFMSGQISLPTLLYSIWSLLSQMWVQILFTIVQAIFNFGVQVFQGAVHAGMNMLNGVANYIGQLPGRVWSYLVQTTSKILSAGIQWVNSAKQKAGETVNSVMTSISQLPGKVYNEFMNIGERILSAGSELVNKAKRVGQNIVDGVLGAMGIHSPGIIQNSISDEFNNTVGKIKDTIKPAGEYATQLGSEIVDKFGTPKLSLNTDDLMPYNDLDANPLENFSFEPMDFNIADMDLSNITSGLSESNTLTANTNTMIGDSYAALAQNMGGILESMVLQDQLAYGSIQSNDINTFNAISSSLNLNLLSMSNMLRVQLAQMVTTHRNAMINASNTTNAQLSAMLLQTENVTGKMRSAWSIMANSIINAAARIRNEATTYFNQLSVTIGNFYKKLQNPSRWAGGGNTGSPSTVRSAGRDPGVMTRLTRGVANSIKRDNQLPYTISAVKATKTGMVSPESLEYMNMTSSSRVNVLDLLQRGECPNCSGGWIDTVPPNVAHIKSTARNWTMKGPAVQTGVGAINTGLAFHVYDFESGSPRVSWNSFVRIADAIAAAVPYDYYYNSEKYGSWQNALAHGAWNCYDGAHAMVALANTCGFSGSVYCGGNWGSDGHCWAEINGHTFDTTARRQRGGWANGPCNYRLPAPSAGGDINLKMPNRSSPPRRATNPFDGLFDLEELFGDSKNDTEVISESNTEEIILRLEHSLNVNIEGDVESVDTDALITKLKDSVTDKRLIDKIADALIKRNKRIARMEGV